MPETFCVGSVGQHSLSTYDLFTHYTSLPHNLIKEKLTEFIEQTTAFSFFFVHTANITLFTY